MGLHMGALGPPRGLGLGGPQGPGKNRKKKPIIFSMFFSFGIGSGPSWMPPWTPWIDIEFKQKTSKFEFWIIFACLTVGQPYSTTRTYNLMLATL